MRKGKGQLGERGSERERSERRKDTRGRGGGRVVEDGQDDGKEEKGKE